MQLTLAAVGGAWIIIMAHTLYLAVSQTHRPDIQTYTHTHMLTS